MFNGGREREIGWTAWGSGVVALWIGRHGGSFGWSSVWPPGMAQLLGQDRVAVPAAAFGALALGLLGAWALGGRRVVERTTDLRGLESWGFGAALGFGVAGTLVGWLGVLGLFSPAWIAAVCIGLGLVALVPGPAAAPRSAAGAPGGVLLAGVAAVAIAGAAALVHAMVPPWQPDALYYQLTLPRLYLEHGGFVPLAQEPVVSGYPGLGQMLFAAAIAGGHDEVAAIASWAHWVLLVLATFLLVRHVARDPADRAAWVAAIAMGAVPIGAVVGSAALVDTITAAQLTLACLAALQDRTALAASCLGFALANKYLALPAAGLIGAALVLRRRDLRTAVVLVGVVALVWAPWAIKNSVAWGTPFFPLHCPTSLNERVTRLVREHQVEFVRNGQATPAWRLPFDVTFAADPDDIGRFQGEVGPLLLALAALPLASGRPRGAAALLGAYGLVLCAVWALASRQVRFLLPAVPPLLAAVLAQNRWPRALPALVVLGAWGAAGWTVNHLRPGYDLAFLAGRETRESYYRTLSATAGLVEAFAALEREPAGSVAFFWEYRGYLCPRAFWPEHAYRLEGWPREPVRLRDELRRIGVRHVLINRTIWSEEVARGVAFEFGPALDGLVALPGVVRVPVPETGGPQIELWRLP